MAGTVIVFDLISALVDTCTEALPSVLVYDGQGVSGDFGDFLMIGIDDPSSDDPTSAVGSLEWAGLGHKASYEHGTAGIACCALAWTGGAGNVAQRSAREAVRDIAAAVESTLRADPNLGGVVPGLMWVRYGGDFRLSQPSVEQGAAAQFSFTIAYEARLV